MPSERKRKWRSLVPPIFGSNIVHRSGNREGNVRFGSKADIGEGTTDVRFTPKSRHRLSARDVRFVPKADIEPH